MGAEIDVVKGDIKHLRSISWAKDLKDALCHQRGFAYTLLPFNHNQSLVPVDVIHHASYKFKADVLHAI